MTGSSSDLSRTGAAIASTAKETAAALKGFSQYSKYVAVAGLNRKATLSARGAISLSNSSHLPAIVGYSDETGDVSSRLGKARDEAAADWIGNERENDGDGASLSQQRRGDRRAVRNNE